MDKVKKPRHIALAAFAAGLLAPLPAILVAILNEGPSLIGPWTIAIYALMFSVPVSLAVSFTFGILLALWLKRAGDTRLITYILVGMAATSIAFTGWALFMWGDDSFRTFKLDQYALLLPTIIVGGLALPIIFWAFRFLGRLKYSSTSDLMSKPRIIALAVTAACALFVIGAELLFSGKPLTENQNAIDRLGTFEKPTINIKSFSFNDQVYTVALPMTADVYRLFEQQNTNAPRLAVQQKEAKSHDRPEDAPPLPYLGFDGTALTLFETAKTDFETACANYDLRLTTADICFSLSPASIELGKTTRQGTSFEGFVQTNDGLYHFQSVHNSYLDDGAFTQRSARGHSVHIAVLRAIGETP